ncbi:helix-turn-helix domain-containing protein [Desulforhopalus singaporensis]|uniref:SOS-response transcriptional repressor LexA (RecA-mediated autopeptidase) n=1 Tax=Desulforhopalus singaporensis TaxID=91360 RepID=A0A1H0VW04_9BACT|nr:LexA family transcriptional regulator [Desulforhopalus singaporensis]SDP82739.1 SOS-response transcriptional repressor LexA (RecA-mediated autopeptidase) [Desulforhopalus singaporensis]
MDNNISNRLTLSRKKIGKTQEYVANSIGISKVSLNRYENGHRKPPLDVVVQLASLYQVSSDWLLTGKKEANHQVTTTDIGKPNVEPAPPPHHPQKQIPVISWVQAGAWQEVQDPFQPGDSDEWIITVETNHPHAFALKIRGDSMAPEFSEGDIVTVDPGVEAINGKYVIVKNGSEEATFKQLIIDGGNVYLKPLNERYPVIDMTGKELHIVGVVVEKRKKY